MKNNEKIRLQRDCYAILACKLLGKTVNETSELLAMQPSEVSSIYNMINKNQIDFNEKP